MYMTFHSDRQHFSTQLSNPLGSTLVIYKPVANPAADFDQAYTEFSYLVDMLSQRGNPIMAAVGSITEAEYQRNLQQYVERFAEMEAAELAELGLPPESEAGKAAMANAQRQVEFVKTLKAQPIEKIRQVISLIRIEVLVNGYMLYFGNVEHEVMGMACFMSRTFERPTDEELHQSGMVELDMGSASEDVLTKTSAKVANRTATGAVLH
jgi:hypothetical protein